MEIPKMIMSSQEAKHKKHLEDIELGHHNLYSREELNRMKLINRFKIGGFAFLYVVVLVVLGLGAAGLL